MLPDLAEGYSRDRRLGTQRIGNAPYRGARSGAGRASAGDDAEDVTNVSKAARTASTVAPHSPIAVCRNNRTTPGYHGESLRSVSQRQSVL